MVAIDSQWGAVMQLCGGAGGDYVNTMSVDSTVLCRHIILDVCSHGPNADKVKAELEEIAGKSARSGTLCELAKRLNEIARPPVTRTVPEHLRTATGLLIDVRNASVDGTAKLEIEFVNAGHPPGVVVSNGAAVAFLGGAEASSNECHTVHYPFGFFEDVEYQVVRHTYAITERLYIVTATDGITELGASNDQGPILSAKEMGELAIAAVEACPNAGPRKILNGICDQVNQRFPDAQLRDDATLSVIVIEPRKCTESARPSRPYETDSAA